MILNAFYKHQIFALDSLVIKTQTLKLKLLDFGCDVILYCRYMALILMTFNIKHSTNNAIGVHVIHVHRFLDHKISDTD